MAEIVDRARDLAICAHRHQLDKAGQPYILHVRRVAAAVAGDPNAEAVAWLHDCIEDAPWTEEKIRCNFPLEVSLAVAALTRWRGHSTGWYYDNVRANSLALRVKLADIADNADEARLARLDRETAARLRRKYAKALAALTGGKDGSG